MGAFKCKDGGTWFAQFRYVDWKGEKQQKTKRGFATKREALEWERQFLMKQRADIRPYCPACRRRRGTLSRHASTAGLFRRRKRGRVRQRHARHARLCGRVRLAVVGRATMGTQRT